MSEGPPRAYRPMVPRMWPQQMPAFIRYREVPMTEDGVIESPLVDPWSEDREIVKEKNHADSDHAADKRPLHGAV